MIRAKFKVTAKKARTSGGSEIQLTPQYDPHANDDERYSKSSPPTGSISLTVDNPSAEHQFELGQVFDVDFREEKAA